MDDQRVILSKFLGKEITGSAKIEEIRLVKNKYPCVLLKNINIDKRIQIDHLWVQEMKSSYFFGIGEVVSFRGRVISYMKNKKKYFGIDGVSLFI